MENLFFMRLSSHHHNVPKKIEINLHIQWIEKDLHEDQFNELRLDIIIIHAVAQVVLPESTRWYKKLNIDFP